MNLREAFDRHYIKDDLSPGTLRKYRHQLNTWERLTDNPPVDAITDETMREFRQAARDAGLSPTTINGTFGDLRAILRRIGPRETGNPAGLGIIAQVPYMRPVKGVRKPPRRISLDAISRAYVACKHARNPRRGVSPAEWWRCLLVMAFTTGLRKGDLFAIRFDDLDLDNRTLRFTAEKTGKADDWPLHDVAVAHILRIQRPAGTLFGGLSVRGGKLYSELRNIQDAAGLPERFGLHDLRRTGATEVERVRPNMGRVFLQHVSRNVSDAFYINLVDELRDCIDAMRLPAGFKSGPKMAVRAATKAQAERVKIRHEDFAAPTTPDPAEWSFSPGAFRFREIRHALAGDKWRALRCLALARRPVDSHTLSEAVYAERRNTGEFSRHRRAIVVVSELRKELRGVFGLADDFDPVPCVYREYQGRTGPRTAYWTLSLPAANGRATE